MRKKKEHGFTMIEALLVVAIIAILAGVAFVGVARYMRSMKKLEFDGYAKEIFIAAQNHLTMSASEGYLGNAGYGTKESDEVYYFVVRMGSGLGDDSIIAQMLPFGAVDGTIQYGGSYIVRYQPESARVLDVFYWSETDGRYKYTDSPNYNDLITIKENKEKMMHFPPDNGNSVIGWYGGENALNLKKGEELSPIKIKIINNDYLKVVIENIDDYNTGGASIDLFIEGLTSGVKKKLGLSGTSPEIEIKSGEVILDDITTSNKHFANILGPYGFIPGENIRIWAKVYYDDKIATPKESVKYTTNSLYANLVKSSGSSYYDTAQISYFRHLENLSSVISSVNYLPANSGGQIMAINKAVQVNDLDWEKAFDNTPSIIYSLSNSKLTDSGFYYPTSFNNTKFEYDGQRWSIKNVKIEEDAPAGLIGSQDNVGGRISNLKLIDFSVNSRSSAGALAGEYGGTIENVIVITEKNPTSNKVSGNSNAGGLVGCLKQGTVNGCAASVYVEATNISTAAAGGLIGNASPSGDGVSCTIKGCYSGGHTENGIYKPQISESNLYDVKCIGGTAGGLIGGSNAGTTINGCYSTCSVEGAKAGGLVGSASGSVTDCYCTGLVKGSGITGAFAGELTGSASKCNYYKIINYKDNEYMNPVAGNDSVTGIEAFDSDTDTFKDFCTAVSGRSAAIPYDETLSRYYNNRYPFKRLGSTSGKFVDIHYGDWPMPMTFFTNTPDS